MAQMCPNPECSSDNPDNASACAYCGASLCGLLGRDTLLEGRYRVTRVLGCGGMGAVYLAGDGRIPGRRVAVKENLNATPQARSQFQTEVSLMVRLSYPGLPEVSDQFTVPGGRQYMVMDYIEGETLEDVVNRYGAWPEDQVITLAEQLLDILSYLHSHAVIHRDVKPANIKLGPGNKPVLVDFGIAKLHAPGQRTQTAARGVGSPGFAPVEQYGTGTDARSDLYSLGAVMYYLLAGQPPPEAPDLAAGTRLTPLRKLRGGVSPRVQRVIFKAMALNPELRYQSAVEMRSDLAVEDDATWVAVPPPPAAVAAGPVPPAASPGGAIGARVPPPPKARPWLAIIGGTGVIGAIGLAVIALVLVLLYLNRALQDRPATTPAVVRASTLMATVQATSIPEPVEVALAPAVTEMATTGPKRPLADSAQPPLPPSGEPAGGTRTPVVTSTPLPASPTSPAPTPSPPATTAPTAALAAPAAPLPQAGPALQGKLAFSLPQGTSYKVYVVEVGPTPPTRPYASIGHARQPALSHDGLWLLVNGAGGGIDAIARLAIDGQQAAPVTCALSTAESGRPTWSPDDLWLAFDGLGADTTNPQIYIQRLGEVDCSLGDNRLLVQGGFATDANGLYPLWGPDDRIYFRSCSTWDVQDAGQCGIWSARRDGSEVLQLTHDVNHLPTDVNWERLLFMFNKSGDWDVYAVGLKGGDPQNLTHHPAADVWGTLSPDGRSIAFLSNRSGRWAIWLAGVDGGDPREWLPINPDWGEVDPNRIGQERMSWSK
jgi:serine/threonine-protein kinase